MSNLDKIRGPSAIAFMLAVGRSVLAWASVSWVGDSQAMLSHLIHHSTALGFVEIKRYSPGMNSSDPVNGICFPLNP